MNNEKLRLILKITLAVMLIGVVVCAVGTYLTAKEYSDSIAEYKELNTYVKVEEKIPDVSQNVEEIQESDESDVETVTQDEVPQIDIDFEMDYDALKEINEEFIGWIVYQPLEISYPVVLAHSDNYYETHSFERVKNLAGAISLDIACKADFTSFNSIIYGHNMRNNTMFGRLKELMEDHSIIDTDPYFYIFTKDKAYKYKIFAAYYTTTGTATYEVELQPTKGDIVEYMDYINEMADYRDESILGGEVSEDMKICTLSTCHGHRTNKRSVVHGILVATEPR